MKVIRSKKAGFCMGVALALRKLDELVEQGKTVGTFGPIIHNPYVVKEYEAKGVRCFHTLDEVDEFLCTCSSHNQNLKNAHYVNKNPSLYLLLRAHGIPKETEAMLYAMDGLCVTDATCPRVKDAQNAINQATNPVNSEDAHSENKLLLLFGDANHPEVDGLVSYAHDEYFISSNLDTIMKYTKEQMSRNIVLAAQTTQDRPLFDSLQQELKTLSNGSIVILDTICDSTRLRQEEALDIANDVDIMVVVGGKNSGNSKRLAEIVFLKNIPTVFVENADELHREVFLCKNTVGLTAGASTPKILVDEVERVLNQF